MRKGLVFGLIAIITFVLAGSGIFIWQFHNYTAQDPEIKINPAVQSYFQNNFDDCRKHFLKQAISVAGRYSGTEIDSLPIESSITKNLYIDYCYIPARKTARKLLILSSGIHGIEGYTGSAVQQMFMEKQLRTLNTDSLGILLIHGLNPFGFKMKRRFTENNVDLNRNCSTSPDLYNIKNTGYNQLYDLLNPAGEVDVRSKENIFFPLTGIYRIIRESLPVLRQAVLQGQYEYPEGLYFGGNQLEPSIQKITPIIKLIGQQYEEVLAIDLHTGYGERGKLHLFPNPVDDLHIKANMGKIFSACAIDWGR